MIRTYVTYKVILGLNTKTKLQAIKSARRYQKLLNEVSPQVGGMARKVKLMKIEELVF
jgi:hypothetical protein